MRHQAGFRFPDELVEAKPLFGGRMLRVLYSETILASGFSDFLERPE
jgi:hypothetical protein